jgi:FkbM family methyltransferase
MSDLKTKIVGGMHLPARDPGNWLIKGGMVDGYPAYQYDRIEAALSLCKKRRTVVDGGAHVGSWSVHFAKHFDKVLAFEPVPDNIECFHLNLARVHKHYPDKVVLHEAALSDHVGSVHLYNAGGKSVSWSVGGTEGFAAPCLTLDSLNLATVDLLKLDVEGHEYEALQGALVTLDVCRPVVVIEEKKDEGQRASNFLERLGMKLTAQMKHDRIYVWK